MCDAVKGTLGKLCRGHRSGVGFMCLLLLSCRFVAAVWVSIPRRKKGFFYFILSKKSASVNGQIAAKSLFFGVIWRFGVVKTTRNALFFRQGIR